MRDHVDGVPDEVIGWSAIVADVAGGLAVVGPGVAARAVFRAVVTALADGAGGEHVEIRSVGDEVVSGLPAAGRPPAGALGWTSDGTAVAVVHPRHGPPGALGWVVLAPTRADVPPAVRTRLLVDAGGCRLLPGGSVEPIDLVADGADGIVPVLPPVPGRPPVELRPSPATSGHEAAPGPHAPDALPTTEDRRDGRRDDGTRVVGVDHAGTGEQRQRRERAGAL